MKHIFEFGLIGGVLLAALAFGGTEMPYFSVVQITFLGLGALLLATCTSASVGDRRLPVVIPLLLVAFVIAQWVHLSGSRNSSGGSSYRIISIALSRARSH